MSETGIKGVPTTGKPTSGEGMTGAQSLIRSLESAGATDIFGIPGGAILPAYDPLMDSTRIRHILVRHEQGAGHAAQGYAAATGRVGVCMATSGPGATNLVTPLADAHMDSVPLVAITGQVGASMIGTDAFQEADIRGITMPITKHNFLVTDPRDIPRTVAEAFHIASTGRPGPVLVDVAKSALQAATTFAWPTELQLPGYRPVTRPHSKQIREAARLVLEARRPVLYVGGGVIRAQASQALRKLAEATGIPVVTTLMARGAFPDSHPQHLGMPGMHGTVAAVAGLQKSDLIISLGARFDDRVTGNLDSFAPGAKVIHADIDPAEIGKNRHADVPIVGDCHEVIVDLLALLTTEADAGHTGDYEAWVEFLAGVKKRYPLGYDTPATGLAPQYVIERLGAIAGPDTIFTSGVGQHQMWAAQFIGYEKPNTWLNSGGLGTMGYAVPAAMGAKVGMPDAVGLGGRRRRLLPDDQPGARDLRDQRHPDQGRDHQQRVARHGPPVADALLQRALLQHRPALQADPRLRQARRRLRLRRPVVRLARAGRRDDREGDGDQRPARRGRLPGAPRRHGVADGRRRHQQRRDQVRARPRARVRRGRPLMTKHTLSVLVENKPGVLARIAGLFSRRGFNIDSLAVGPTEHPEISRMTIVVNVEESPLEQVTKQLNKLVEVIKIVELDQSGSIDRELMLVKVRADAATRGAVLDAVQLFRAKVVDVAPDAVTIQVTGNSDKLADFLRVLEPFGIRELVQSGMVAIGRGSRSISERSLRPVPVPAPVASTPGG